MSWLARYRFKLYVLNSVWIFPSLSIILALLTVVLLSRIDRALGWEMNISEDTARMVMGTVAASMFTLVVVGSSAIMLVVQLASACGTLRSSIVITSGNYRCRSLYLPSLFQWVFWSASKAARPF